MHPQTLANTLLEILAGHGVRHLFGVPGGGSSLALIEAAGRHGIEFVLTRTETAAALMAAVSGELGDAPGVVLTGIGPGAASAVNGIAYASLERAPVLLFTDGPAASLHQAFDQSALFAPISKASLHLRPDTARRDIEQALETALALPQGPVHLNLSAGDASAPVAAGHQQAATAEQPELDRGPLQRAQALIRDSRRPIIIAGLDSRQSAGPGALAALAAALACPVLLTYKAKGVLAEDSPWMAGLFTGAHLEARCLEAADLVLFYGLDPVEIIPGPWALKAPVLDLCTIPDHAHSVAPAVRLCAPLEASVKQLLPGVPASSWEPQEIGQLRASLNTPLALGGAGHTVATVIAALIQEAPEGCRLCVDAGAHMFSAMQLWPARQPCDVLKSNGLSTMGFALPAAIASALHEPRRPVIALSGDGGLLMCLSELSTAAARGCNILVVVINDAALSLIDIKQQRLQHPCAGVRYPPVDFAAAARALGCAGWRIGSADDPAPAIAAAFAHEGPALLDVHADASGYLDQLQALRG